MTGSSSWQKTHIRDLLLLALQKCNVNCCFCDKPFTMEDFPKRKTDLITEHHTDGDHMNMAVENRTFSHRTCHKRYHMKERRNKQ